MIKTLVCKVFNCKQTSNILVHISIKIVVIFICIYKQTLGIKKKIFGFFWIFYYFKIFYHYEFVYIHAMVRPPQAT